MSHKVRFTAEGPMSKFDTLEDLMTKEGYKIIEMKLAKRGEKVMPKGIIHNHYKKPAMEIVYDALTKDGNKAIGMTATVVQLKKSLDMPIGTISGSLAKLHKLGRVEKAGSGKWKAK